MLLLFEAGGQADEAVGAFCTGLVPVVGQGLVFNCVKFEAPVKGLIGALVCWTGGAAAAGWAGLPQLPAAAQLGENPRFSFGLESPQVVGKLSMPEPFCWFGDGPKTDVLTPAACGGVCGRASCPLLLAVIGLDPNIEVPVDLPSSITQVVLKISSNSFKALYLSSALTAAGPWSVASVGGPASLLTGVKTEFEGILGVLDTFFIADHGSVNVFVIGLVFKNKLEKNVSPNFTVSFGILNAGSKNGFLQDCSSSSCSSASRISLDKSGMDGFAILGANL